MQLEHWLIREADRGAAMPARDENAESCARVEARDWWLLVR